MRVAPRAKSKREFLDDCWRPILRANLSRRIRESRERTIPSEALRDAIPAAGEVFKSRNIGADQVPPASGPQLPLDEAAEMQRATRVGQQFGQIAPSLVQYTTDVLFRDLWLRPGLAPRDRSLVTVSALVATGQVAQITYHLNRAMDNGLTRDEAGEVLGHLAFYAGWPNAFSAAPIINDVIEKRPR